MKTRTILLTALALTPSTATLKGAQRRSNLRQRILHKSKTSAPTLAPSESPTLSPTECTKGCDKEKESSNDVVTPSPAATTLAPTATTLAPTFTDFVDSPPPTFISDETGEPESNNGIGIGVDVGGNENIVDVTVIITQNGGDVNAGGGDGAAEDDLLDDYIYSDDDGSMSTSMSMSDDDSTYGETEDAVQDVMEKPEDVADIEADDDFSTFFDNSKKKETPSKDDPKGL